jgi:accessory gene regulator protein AgrB
MKYPDSWLGLMKELGSCFNWWRYAEAAGRHYKKEIVKGRDLNKNQKIVLIIGYIVLFVVFLISPPAYLNPARYGGYYQAIVADAPAGIIRGCIAGVTLLGWYAFKDKRKEIQKR